MNLEDNNNNNIEYTFYVGDKRYSGTIILENDTHYIINDKVKNKKFHLPKVNTVLEVIE